MSRLEHYCRQMCYCGQRKISDSFEDLGKDINN